MADKLHVIGPVRSSNRLHRRRATPDARSGNAGWRGQHDECCSRSPLMPWRP